MAEHWMDDENYEIELKRLKESGGLDKVAKLIKSQADVWIKRSSGAWQKGKTWVTEHDGLMVGVKWYDEKRGKVLGKYVNTADFLQWQEKDHGERELIK
ncbi:hypothetical protein HZB94_04875 [Candidatus Falkowbacteria bacterium]|nr:hypothetical protein [Candidatus Falkowbacteria bacterium]